MLSKTILKWIVLGTSVFWISACESTGSGVSVPVPRVDVSCSSAKCAVSGIRDVYVTFSLSGCADDQLAFEPESVVAGSDDVLCSGASCTGTVTQFSPSTIESRSYYVCGRIDIDNNGIPSAADAFSEEQMFISGSPITLSNWSVSYFILRQRFQKQ